MSSRFRPFLAAIVALAFGLSACGGDEEGSGGTSAGGGGGGALPKLAQKDTYRVGFAQT